MAEARKRSVTLSPVAVGDDGAVILARRANARTGGYRLRVTDDLLELIRQAQEKAERAAAEAQSRAVAAAQAAGGNGNAADAIPRVGSKLSPREIQALLRQGKSVSSIAKKAGVDPAWVERFEGPIAWERAGMATRAQRSTLVRARMGPSGAPLGEAVAANLRLRGASGSLPGAGWDAVRHPKQKMWIVTLSFQSRGRTNIARWEFDPETEAVTPLSKLAGEIGWVPKKRRKR